MDHEERWQRNLEKVTTYIMTFRRLPSRHRIEDHRMLNWIKHNKKMIAQQRLPEDRLEKFNALMETATKFKKLNQYTYARHGEDTELSLFD